MLIGGLQKFSLLDYPGKVSCIVFTVGCNFSCGYCHNPELLKKTSSTAILEEDSFFDFLKSRKGKLDAVVISGGEPTIHKDLLEFIQKIKQLGFLVKLDTNGTNVEMLSDLLDKEFVDYIAMDIKGPFDKYNDITNIKVDPSKIKKSIELIKKSGVGYEFRTTVVKGQLVEDDFKAIAKLLTGSEKYYLQKFIASKTNNPEFMAKESYESETLDGFVKILLRDIKLVCVR